MATLWSVIENAPTAAAAFGWRQWLGQEFEKVASVFLRKKDRTSETVPCPHQCGCGHRVVPAPPGFLGLCNCDDPQCEELHLSAEDAVVWEFDGKRLARALARAWNLEAQDGAIAVKAATQVGTFGGGALSVVLVIAQESAEFQQAVMELVTRLNTGFVVLSPTGKFYDANIRELLSKANAGFFALEAQMLFGATGKLQPCNPAGELFSQYLPERRDTTRAEEVKRIFGIYRKLAGSPRTKKASLDAVFRLLVLDDRNQRQASEQLDCAPSLITRRVRAIERAFNLTIEQLKGFASDVGDMESSVKGDRLIKKKHGVRPDSYEAATEQEGDEDKGNDD